MSANRQNRKTRALLATVAVWMAPPVARATVVQYGFAGVVTEIVDHTFQIYPQYIDYGSPITGTFTVDLDTPDSAPNSLDFGQYVNAIRGLTGRVGALDFSGPADGSSEIHLFDDFHEGQFIVDSFEFLTNAVVFGRTTFFGLGLADWAGLALSGDGLAEAQLQSPSFTRNDFTIVGTSLPGFPRTRGVIAKVWVVPEPASVGLLAGGYAFILYHRRPRR